MKKFLIAAVFAVSGLSLTPVLAQQGYEMIDPPQKTESGDKVEVTEFFWYGCPHCYSFLPHIEEWAKDLPDNVVFRLEAPPLNPSWTLHSRAFYAAETMGVLDQFHVPMFNAIHIDRRKMDSMQEIVDFVAGLGIDKDQFYETMTSFAVETKVRKSNQAARKYRLRGVPAVAVNGKYMTNGSLAGGYPQLIKIINQLVERESR